MLVKSCEAGGDVNVAVAGAMSDGRRRLRRPELPLRQASQCYLPTNYINNLSFPPTDKAQVTVGDNLDKLGSSSCLLSSYTCSPSLWFWGIYNRAIEPC